MGTSDQLKLLLWKDFLVRRRHMGVASLVFGWATAVFLILYIVRESVDLEYNPSCQHKARSLPSTGLFPFVQSFICNVDNKCSNLSQYEEVPQYENARLTAVAQQLQEAFSNKTILNVIKTLPNMIDLLKAIGNSLDSPDLVDIFGPGVKINELFDNSEQLKSQIKNEFPNLAGEVIDDLFDSYLKLGHLFKSLSSTDISSSICNAEKLDKFLILENPKSIENISLALCNITGDQIPTLIQNLFDNIDFDGLLNMIGKTVNYFTNYNIFDDLRQLMEVFLGLNFVKDNVPANLKLYGWLPKIISSMKNINRTYIDKDFIKQSLQTIEPYFIHESLWPKYKNLIYNITDLFILIQNNILARGPYKTQNLSGVYPKNFSQFVAQLENGFERLKNPSKEDIEEKHEIMLKIANDLLNAVPGIIFNTSKPWLLSVIHFIANIMDSLTPIINNTILNQMSRISFIYGETIFGLYNTFKHEVGSEKIMYNLCEKHSNTVSTLFSLGPDFIRNILQCFGNATCTNVIVANKNNISQIFCDKDKTEELLPEASSIKNIGILCNIELNAFIQDLIIEFNLDWINKTITEYDDGLNAGSFRTAVVNTENFVDFIKNRKISDDNVEIDWEHLFPDFENTEWNAIAKEAKRDAGLYMVNVQLSYLKENIKHKTNYHQLLNSSSVILEGIITQYELFPKYMLQIMLKNLPSVLETVIRTFTNKTQLMTLTSIDDWEKYFCDSTNNVICEIIVFFNTQTNRQWFEHPLLMAIYNVLHNKESIKDLNWNKFSYDVQNIYLTISEILSIHIPQYNWQDMEVFQSKYWINWMENIQDDTEIRFGISLVSKIGDMIEKHYLDRESKGKWKQINEITSTVNNFVVFVLNLMDFAISSENIEPEVSKLYPETYNLSKIVIANFDSMLNDLTKIIDEEIVDIVKLSDWLQSPCKKNIVEILSETSASTKYTFSVLENALCNNEKYVNEWKNANFILQQNKSTNMYANDLHLTVFRLLKLFEEVHQINPQNIRFKTENIPKLKIIHLQIKFQKILFKVIDKVLETSILRKDTIRELWTKLKTCKDTRNVENCDDIENDTTKYVFKYISAGLYQVANNINKYLHIINDTKGVDPIKLIGFSNTSGIYTTYLKLPDFIKVFITSYRSTEFETQIFQKLSKRQNVKCDDIMSYLTIPENNSVTINDINALKRYVCPSIFDWPIMEDNLFLSTITKLQDLFLDTPVSKLNITFIAALNEIFDLKTNIISMVQYGKINITELWNEFWTKELEETFQDISKMQFTSNNTITRYFKYIDIPRDELNISYNLIDPKFGFGDFSYLIKEIFSSLDIFQMENFTSTNLTDLEDIKQLQNLIDFYAKETASILAYIYLKSAGDDFNKYFDTFCMEFTNDSVSWIREDKNKIVHYLCQVKDENVRLKLIPINKLKVLKNYNVNLEDIVINFISTLQNYMKNDSTIYLSKTFSDHFDLSNIFNRTFPTEEELRNTSLIKAKYFASKPKRVIFKTAEVLKATTILLKVLQGGKWWENLLAAIKEPEIKIWLQILERIPTIILHLSNAAISPHFLYDITSKVSRNGPGVICSENFNLKLYLRDENILSVIKDICTEKHSSSQQVISTYVNETDLYDVYNQEIMENFIFDFEISLVELIKQGPKIFELPNWMNETRILQSYESYAKQNSKPLKLLQIVTVVLTEIVDIGSVYYKNQTNNCSWCNIATILVKEASFHLSKSQQYTEFLCNAPNLNFTEIRNVLINDFKWGKIFENVLNNETYSVEDFDLEIHDIIDVIRLQLITFYTNKTLQNLPAKCLAKITDSPALKNITTYISAVRELTKALKESSFKFLNTSLLNISNVIELYIPILKPFNNLLKTENNLEQDLTDEEVDEFTVSKLLLSKVDVNTLNHINTSNDLEAYFNNYNLFTKLFTFDNLSRVLDIYSDLHFSNKNNVVPIIFNSIDGDKLNEKISEWRQESSKNLNWVANIFESLEKVLFDGGNILEFISNVDFNAISDGNFDISSLLRGVLDLLQNHSIEKLFQSLRELIKASSPIIRNETIQNDLLTLVDGIENLKIFKNLGLLRLKYKISDLVKDWKDVKQYLISEIYLDESTVESLLNASIDLSEIISSQENSLNFKTLLCSPNELTKIISFNTVNPNKTITEISKILCNLTLNEIQNIATISVKHINLSKVLNTVMDSSVDSILTSANMTEDEGKEVVKNIGIGAELLPYLKSMVTNISGDFNMLPKFEKLEGQSVISSDLLSSASTLLCGRPLVQKSNKLYDVISKTKDFNAEKYDIMEQESLPTDFCRNVYKDIVKMQVGKLIWSYVKPLLRGQILYTPDVPAVRNILENANSTFYAIAVLEDIFFRITTSLVALEDRENINHIIDNIQDFLNSSIVKIAVQSVLKNITNSKISLEDVNLKEVFNSFGSSQSLTSALKFGSDFLRCVLLDRFVGLKTEQELEDRAKQLMNSNEFIAGIVFLDINNKQKRSTNLPNEISYKIRMDIDSVPSTSYMKYKFWTPGPESDFLDELRYFRGFIQLQDLIDNAIIKMKAGENLSNWETLTQEMPYACWTKDFFKSALSISQTFQVCFFFGLIAVVAAAVRNVVWEKESGNTMLMNVMGLRYITHCTSWFIVTLAEMIICIILIFSILKIGGILPLTNGFLMFLYLLEFGLSVIMFCYMISSMFNSASLAAVGSAIFYLLSYMPYIIIISLETNLSFGAKLITNLSMSTSFCYGCLYMIRYELQGVGLQWNNTWDTPIPGDTMNFGLTCIFLLFDSILYGIIGYIFSRRSQDLQLLTFLPSWFFSNSYQVVGANPSYITFDNDIFLNVANNSGENYLDDTVSSTNIVNDEPLKIGVTIKGLTKIYNSRKKSVRAIENIDITLYTGQVTTLLGHNGAGKTTLIKILTGMMKPTSGEIIINSEITENTKNKSRFLGVCPQGSVLIDTMSPLEHLIFYAKLKTSRTTKEAMPEIMDMIDSMSLGRLSNEPVSNLSDGMRRRLCVAIAFIGKPKLVVLDEPSSGVDPVARRQIWELVIRYKEGCTVLLTTHYLDEAELLSDRVVVLHKGKVLCSGSPLILRQSYGSGYKLTVSYPADKEFHQTKENSADILLSIVKKTTPNAFLSEVKDSSIDIIIPFNSSEGILNDFENVALSLEENQHSLGFLSFNMNCATLEQVFLDLCEKADVKENEFAKNADTISQLGKSYSNVFSSSVNELSTIKDDDILIDTGEQLTGKNMNKFFALLKKRFIHYTYDWRVIICALVLPTVFTAIAMGFSLIRPPNITEPALKLTPDLYQPQTTSFISVNTNDMGSFINKVSTEIVALSPHKDLAMYQKSARECVCENGMQKCGKSSQTAYDALLKLSTANETLDWLVETQNEYIERRYGGWSLSDQFPNKSSMVVWYNNKGYHSMPSYLNTLNSAILRTVSPGSSITTYSHPLKLSVDQLSKSSIAQHIADVGIAMVLLIAFSLVPASGSIYLVQERVEEEKRMQFLCGVSPTLYWTVAFIWDLIILVCSLALSVGVFKIFALPVYVSKDNLAAVSLLIFLYGWACIPFIHLAQRFFNDASMANMILFCVCTFIGISQLTCLLLMDILGKTQFVADFRIILHNIYLIFPQFVLGDGLVEISKNNIQSEILQRFHMETYISPLSWELMGSHYLSLAIVGIVLFIINLIIENEWLRDWKKSSTPYTSDITCLEIVNLKKVYKTVDGTHTAVDNISLKVDFGQCLGLIGVNGAGKSTTFKMLTTELRPTSGRIFLQGQEICRKPLFTGEMGYCSQSNSLDPKLTVGQTLNLYLTLRGTRNKSEILKKMLKKFELASYANRKNENLSGGNKRKLCTALSVLGKTSLILMDEPTSGMDPHSRNLVANTIQQLIKQNRSIILTSHSVEDCEALCSNIAVMINGRIICQGTPQDLKERHGSGYIISVRLAKPTDQDLLLELMKKHFPGSELMSRQHCSSQYSVPTNKTKISEMFNRMNKISESASVEDYNLVQSSLDQVFINLANKNEASTGVTIETKLPNMYSMDVI